MAENRYRSRTYSVVDYDPAWPAWYEETAAKLREAFGPDAIAIEHIGSTSVPGMAGKAALDVLVLVPDMECVQDHLVAMHNLGYDDLGQFVMKDSRLFRKMRGNELMENVHVFPAGHPHVAEMLALREYLRAHPEEAEAYSALKKKLAKKYPGDYGKYRELKDAYVEELMKRALA
jgi:GrpB-like predicted nucleotidyltransferase (UPF0157 family)